MIAAVCTPTAFTDRACDGQGSSGLATTRVGQGGFLPSPELAELRGTPAAASPLEFGGHDRLVMVAEAARRFRVPRATVHRLVAEGRLAHVPIWNQIRFLPGVVDPGGGPRAVVAGQGAARVVRRKTVETYRTTKALRELVRRAARVVDKRPSEFLRQAAEEKARAVLREAAGENLRKLLARLPPGCATSEAAAERLGEKAARSARKRGA